MTENVSQDEDVRELSAAAHRRGIRVILDYVVNHVSADHAAFQAASVGAEPLAGETLYTPGRRPYPSCNNKAGASGSGLVLASVWKRRRIR